MTTFAASRSLAALVLGLAALLLALPAAHAADDPCFQKAQTQADLNACAVDTFKRADADLNQLYKQISARLKSDDAVRQRLVDAQRKWLRFRDAECAFETIRTLGGSIQPTAVNSCLAEQTRMRVIQLQNHLACAQASGEAGDGGCAVPSVR